MPRPSDLCTDCGICCNGTLFTSVALEPADLVVARQHRLPVLETAHTCSLPLPCAALRGVLCEIYEDRPERCAEYACELLLRVQEHGLKPKRARAIIRETREIHERVIEAIGTKPWWVALNAAKEAQSRAHEPDGPRETTQPNLLDDLLALEALVHNHFWG